MDNLSEPMIYNTPKDITYGYRMLRTEEKGNFYAFKYLPSDFNKGLDHVIEIDIESRVLHPHIMHALKLINASNGIAVVLPLADRVLSDTISTHMTTADKLPILYRLACAVDFLHDNKILHLNISLENIVLKGIFENDPCFINFSSSLIVNDIIQGQQLSELRGSPKYLAPELLTETYTYTGAIDIWAFGIMMLTLIVEQPLSERPLPELLRGVHPKYQELCLDFFTKVLDPNPTQRLTAKQLVNHPLFDGVRITIEGTIIQEQLIVDYAQDNRELIKLLVVFANKLYANESVELLFLAAHLYYRISPYYKEESYFDRFNLAITVLWLSAKLTNSKLYPISQYLDLLKTNYPELELTISDFRNLEIEIIRQLNGILWNSPIYHICKTGDDLIYSLEHVILNSQHTKYAEICNDTSTWSANLPSSTQTSLNNKNITINDLGLG